MTFRIRADVIVDMSFHHLVILGRHALAALAAALAMLQKDNGGVLHRKFGRVAPEGTGAHLPFGRDAEGIRFLTALELAALTVTGRIRDIGDPHRGFGAVGIFPRAFADRHAFVLPPQAITGFCGTESKKALDLWRYQTFPLVPSWILSERN